PAVVTQHSIAESRRRLQILLAEDNAVNQEVAATMLRKRGHDVDVVGGGQALRCDLDGHPDARDGWVRGDRPYPRHAGGPRSADHRPHRSRLERRTREVS